MVSEAIRRGSVDAVDARLGSIRAMSDPDAEVDPRLDAWTRLADGDAEIEALVAAAAEVVVAGTTPASIMRLRRRFSGMPVAEALELAAARHRARGKFPDHECLLADRHGLEQATSTLVAAWKARRFGDRPVLDLCCGIGGDAMALAARGPCVGVDRDPVRALMTARNAGIETRVEAVESTTLDAPLVHLDPARRDEAAGRRSWRLEDLVPGMEEMARIVSEVDGAAIKLGPGLPLPPPRWHERQSVSIVAEDRRLVQGIVWTGVLARSATCEAVDLPSGDTIEGEPAAWPTRDGDPFGEVLVELHPAVERVRLGPVALGAALGEASDAFGEPARSLGLVTGPAAPIDAVVGAGGDRWFRAVRVEQVVPARLEIVAREVAAMVAAGPPAAIVVRTRAGAIDADAWTKRLASTPGDRDPTAPTIEVGGWRVGRRTLVTLGRAIR